MEAETAAPGPVVIPLPGKYRRVLERRERSPLLPALLRLERLCFLLEAGLVSKERYLKFSENLFLSNCLAGTARGGKEMQRTREHRQKRMSAAPLV